MSTRCQIGIYENAEQDLLKPTTIIYRHHDGDPACAGKDLAIFAREFDRIRGMDDMEYFSASLVAFLKFFHCGNWMTPRGDFSMLVFNGRGLFEVTGHGISTSIHTDIEYFYRVNCEERELVFYEAHLPYNAPYGESNFKEIKRLSVKARKDRHALS